MLGAFRASLQRARPIHSSLGVLRTPRAPVQVFRTRLTSARPPSRRALSTPSPSSPPPHPPKRYTVLRVLNVTAKYTLFLAASTVLGTTIVLGAFFVHDAFTYTDRHIERVPVSPLALWPERGGPKNLPVARVLVSDDEDETMQALKDKPRLVILGGGWGAVSTLESLKDGEYHVTVISPETFNTFTPLLPSAAVGTVSVRSLIEPIRKIVARVHGQFMTGRAVDIVMGERLLEIETLDAQGKAVNVYIPYDKLVIAVGSVSSTHGVPGLENCFQLKTVSDAQAIRRRVLDNFEIAALPTTSPEERKRLLTFVVCGGGPTGVETAAEIHDLCHEDVINYYPKICREEVSIHIIQSRAHILNTYSEAISQYAERKFQRDHVDLVTNARVTSVSPTTVRYSTKNDSTGEVTQHEIPTNFVLWSTGIAMNPFTARVSSLLPNQVHRKAIEVDAHLRVKGSPLGTVYAVGDCSTIETGVVDHLLDFVEVADRDKNGKIDFEEWKIMVNTIKKKIPMTEVHLERLRDMFDMYDQDKDDALTLNELAILLQELGNKITALPATAQVASQQGKYLGKKLNMLAARREVLIANDIADTDEAVSGPFRYSHLGSLAYIGNAAVFDLGGHSFTGGLAAMYAWRSVYWSEQVSMRTRALLMIDWIVRGVWGRDLSKL